MKKLLTIAILATLMTSSLALARAYAYQGSLFSIGPSETPSEAVILEGTVNGRKLTNPTSAPTDP